LADAVEGRHVASVLAPKYRGGALTRQSDLFQPGPHRAVPGSGERTNEFGPARHEQSGIF
jgi:hypothetical protein